MASIREKLPENIRKRGKNYYFRCRIDGKQKDLPLGPDLSVAKSLAKHHAARLLHIKAGFADPREAKWADSERRPLADHVQDWRDYLKGKGDDPRHYDQSRTRVLKLIDIAKIMRISGLTISAVQTALAEIRLNKGRCGRKQMGDNALHYYARTIKSFSRWLWRDGRVRDDPLVHMELPEVNDKMTRRALEAEEAAALLDVTPTLRRRAGLPGPDRAIVYATALGTGFRLAELMSLTPESFDVGADPPTITCLGKNTKNGRDAIQPIRPELAAMLRPWLVGKPPGEPVFLIDYCNAAPALRSDLKEAGVDSSECYDFHCLRHTYVTMLIKSGANVKVCQELARHSDPKLTMNLHTHLTVHDMSQGLEGLAHILPTKGVSKGLTGTDRGAVISSQTRSLLDPTCQNGKMIAPKAPSGGDLKRKRRLGEHG
jgi:integrase